MTAPQPVRGRPCETALVVAVPEAEPLVGDFRRRFDTSSVSRRIPPHVTLLYPFVHADAVDDDLIADLRRFYEALRPFEFELAGVARFEGNVWLAPEPGGLLVDLINRTYARFPEHEPYGGAFAGSEPVPHLTIGRIGDQLDIATLLATAERELGERLPLPCVAAAVSLLEEQPDGTWQQRATVPLGGR